ncbi:MAG: hypothetical protein J7K81_09005 [Methanophagales archaeon]|nr:hypothetical protein [Methanophagales archaeon]
MNEKTIFYTPATGYPDLEAKIAYGLARVGIEAFESEKVLIKPLSGYYAVKIDGNRDKLNKAFNFLCKRILRSGYIFSSTPGIKGKAIKALVVKEKEYTLEQYVSLKSLLENKKSEAICRHESKELVGAILGLAAETSYHRSRNKIDIQGTGRPTNPKRLCKSCALLATLGTWYASFIFNIAKKEVMVIPTPKNEIRGEDIEKIFSIQHMLRKEYIKSDIPSNLIPLIFLSEIPSATSILWNFDLFVALYFSPGNRGYHIENISLIPIENYLGFLEDPYNVATVDEMKVRGAFKALQELNKIIGCVSR